MLTDFLKFISKNKLFKESDKILLTVSGGLDSVVMADLFKSAGINFEIAHCNFQLRGKESDADEKFVEKLAVKYKVPFYIQKLETEKYASSKKLSIQMAARELRYSFFEKIRKQNKFDFIATAHHADDVIETVLINLIRGSGIAAYHGISVKNKKIIRPLLFASRDSIENYAKEKKLKWREDSSNESDDYTRNKIRHHVIPVLKEINPSLQKTFHSHLEKMNDAELLYNKYISNQESKLLSKKGTEVIIDLKLVKKLPAPNSILFELLKPYNFNTSTVDAILENSLTSSGQIFNSSDYSLLKNRDQLIIVKRKKNKKQLSFESINLGSKLTGNGFSLITEKIILTPDLRKQIVSGKLNDKHITYVDAELIKFPLEVRNWQKGDSFYPLGMNNSKLLSDYFIDRKFSIFEKEKILLLISDKKIVWVLGERLDNRFKITPNTVNCFRFIFENKL